MSYRNYLNGGNKVWMSSYFYEVSLDPDSQSLSMNKTKFTRGGVFGVTALYRDSDMFLVATGMHWNDASNLAIEGYIYSYISGKRVESWDNFMRDIFTSYVVMGFAVNRNSAADKVKRVYAFAPAFVTGSNIDFEKYDSTKTHTIFALQFDTLPTGCSFMQAILI